MKLFSIAVSNYKGLLDVECELSNFVCIVGENNAGKSSLLQAVLLFINGTKLSKDAFYDPKSEILITVRLSGITKEVLDKLEEEHRQKIEPYIVGEEITLARRYATDGTSKLRVVTFVPNENKYRQEYVSSILAGKKGAEIHDLLAQDYSEIVGDTHPESVSTQKAAKELIEKYVVGLPQSEFHLEDIALPTGIDNSVRAIMPEPIYIPAVKDLVDDMKTKEAASFGKLLSILLNVIEEDLDAAAETFEILRRKLTRIRQPDGTVLDERMERVKRIEETIQNNLKETFRDVTIEIEIPPPEIKTVLSNVGLSETLVEEDQQQTELELLFAGIFDD
jgi:ABC-type dipeptide/oligopeptide/nickel transport system ATPase component